MNIQKQKIKERTDEIQDIIDRLPVNFSKIIAYLLGSIFLLLLLSGVVIKYPDVVTGQVIINAQGGPVKLVANTSGKLHLGVFLSQSKVKTGNYLGYIENSAKTDDVIRLSGLLAKCNINRNVFTQILKAFPKRLQLGELNAPYFNFLNALQSLANNECNQPFSKQREILEKMRFYQKESLMAAKQRILLYDDNLNIVKKNYQKDSLLFNKKVLSNADLDKTESNYLNAKQGYQNIYQEIIQIEQQIQQTENELQKNSIQEEERYDQMRLELVSTYTDLMNNLKAWEQKYCFKSPLNGRVQYLNFWTNGQFVQSGEAIFSILPTTKNLIGEVYLPISGAGKVEPGQEVVLKLESFPYQEYGTIKGKVKSVSLSTNSLQAANGRIDTYLVLVDLPEQLTTNLGNKLKTKSELKGSAEIIVHKRRLLQRLFDNLKPSGR